MPDSPTDYAALERAAGGGDLRAMVALATEHELGRDRLLDLELAEAWYRRAADRDYAVAQYCLGLLLWRASPDARIEERNMWLLRAAERGHRGALFWLGVRYELGCDGFMLDHATALERYREAAERGSADAQLRLGIALVRGDLGTKDGVEARRWLSEAYGRGRAAAGYWLRVIPFMRLPLPPRAPTIAVLRAVGLALLGLHAIRVGIDGTGALLGMLGVVVLLACVAQFHRRPLALFRATAGEDGIALAPIILFGFTTWSVAVSGCLFGALHYPSWSAKSCVMNGLAYGCCIAVLVPYCGVFSIVAGHFLFDVLALALHRRSEE